MVFNRVDEALRVLEDLTIAPTVRGQASAYLSHLESTEEIHQLVDALRDDDFGIRWEAANILARMGRRAVPALLEALLDPYRVGDLRLRLMAYHVLHSNSDNSIRSDAARLMQALHSPSPDLEAMLAANDLWIKLRLEDKNAL